MIETLNSSGEGGSLNAKSYPPNACFFLSWACGGGGGHTGRGCGVKMVT